MTEQQQLEIITEFVSILLDHTEEQPSEFAKLVDEHFWELV